jgi:glycosyltransferase involved in cell wall biosynthesis
VSSYHTRFAQYLQFYHFGWLAGPTWHYLRWFHNRTRVTFCPTESIRQELCKQGIRQVGVWSRGVDSDRFHPAKRDTAIRERLGIRPDEVVLLYAGRLAAEKNLEMLYEAFQRLPQQVPLRLLLVGDGPLRGRLERDSDGRVIFAGYRHGEELAQLYASSDIFVFPSLTETFGNVVTEAMASGLAVVAFRAPGPKDVIQDGRTGVLVSEINARAFSTAVIPYLESPDARARLGRAARRWAEAQTWDSVNRVVRDSYIEAGRSALVSLAAVGTLAAHPDIAGQGG